MSNENVKNLEKLKNKIGTELFVECINEMPGVILRFPNNAEHYNKQQRNKQIIKDYHNGMEIHDLMKEYSLSRSRIYKIIENG